MSLFSTRFVLLFKDVGTDMIQDKDDRKTETRILYETDSCQLSEKNEGKCKRRTSHHCLVPSRIRNTRYNVASFSIISSEEIA